MIYGNITNCSVVGHGVISAWQCRLGYQIISENTATNTRQIKLQLEARSVNSNYTTVGYQLTPTIDGLNLTPIGMNFSQANTNVWQVLGTRIITLVGAFNGEKYGSFITNFPGEWGLKSGSASVDIVLDNLHTPPQITGIAMQETNELLNNATDIVQFLSVKNYTFDTTTFDDATISSYQVYHNGVLIGSSTENDLTIDYDSVGTLATFEMDNKIFAMLRFVVIDSYKTSSFIEVPYEVTAYVKPNLVKTSSSIKRNGQLSGKVKLSLIGMFFNQAINEIPNVINLQFKYWKKGAEEPNEYYDIPYEAIDNNINLFNWAMAINGEEIEDVDSNFAYNFKIKATDYFNKTSEIELLCPVGEYLWAEFKDRVDFKNITMQGVKIIESGNNSYGDYIKFSDGTMICLGAINGSTSLYDYWGQFKRTEEDIQVTFPATFKSNPYVVANGTNLSGIFAVLISGIYTTHFNFTGLKANNNADISYGIYYQAFGKWK